LQQQITDEILREAAPAQWEEDLRRAVQDGNESQKNILLAQFKRRVALMLIERAIPERLKEHVPQEWARNSISEAIGKQFRKCLESFQDNHSQFDPKLDSCVTRATNSATYEVFRFRLGLALDEQFPTYKVTDQAEKSRNEAAKRAINTVLMTRQLHTEVARA